MKAWYVLQACYIVLVILANIKGDDIVAVLYQICLLIAFAVPDLSKTREVK